MLPAGTLPVAVLQRVVDHREDLIGCGPVHDAVDRFTGRRPGDPLPPAHQHPQVPPRQRLAELVERTTHGEQVELDSLSEPLDQSAEAEDSPTLMPDASCQAEKIASIWSSETSV